MISREFILKNWFTVSLVCFLILSFTIRFYNYENRWGLAYDQAYSALVARHAVSELKLPLVGPFSSAGPMQTGGEWYWFVMLGTVLDPDNVMSPWIFLTLTYVFFVVFIVFLGKELIDKKFGIILGILTLVSTAQIAQSVSLTNQSPLALSSLIAIWGMIKYIKTKKLRFLLLQGLGVSLAITFHFQGIALVIFLFFTVLIARVGIRGILVLLTGFFIPLIPLLIFDLQNDFVNSKNIIQYYFFDQYKISFDALGRRWKTYVGVFWPNAWAHIIGGHKLLGYLVIGAAIFSAIFHLLKGKIKKEWQIILLSFGSMVVLVRYVRTPLYDSYLVFLHPFVLLLTGWVILLLYRKNKILGIVSLIIIVLFSLAKDVEELNFSKTNYVADETRSLLSTLTSKFPNEKFSVYSYKYQSAERNLILSLFLDSEEIIDINGRPVGLVSGTESAILIYPSIEGSPPGLRLIDLESSSTAELKQSDWVEVNPGEIYRVTEQWYTK